MVVSMGRICYQKAPERFAELAARFQIAEVPARFVWIGGGSAAGEAALRASGVEVTGWLSSAQVQHWLSQADVYVQTSRWEGMPLSVLQALAAGVPCVTTNVVGNRDAVRQGFTGDAIKHHDELVMTVLRLVRDSALRERFSQAARTDAAARFSGGSFRQRLLALYSLDDQHAPAAKQPRRVPPLTALRILGSAS
jgi:glycosyltransferase involved in cell wall biosynthesis